MKKSIFLVLIFALFGGAFPTMLTAQQTTFNSVSLHKADTQPYKNATILQDSLGGNYINLTLKLTDAGFLPDNGTGLDGSLMLALQNMTAEEIKFIIAYADYKVAKRKAGD